MNARAAESVSRMLTPKEHDAAVPVSAPGGLEERRLFAARHAPGRPEVDNHRALVLLQGEPATIEQREFERSCGPADERGRDVARVPGEAIR